MRVMAGGALDFVALPGVVQPDIAGVQIAVCRAATAAIEIGNVIKSVGVGLEIHARAGGRITDADRVVVPEVGADHEHVKVRSLREHGTSAGAAVANGTAGGLAGRAQGHVAGGVDRARVGPGAQEGAVDGSLLTGQVAAAAGHVDDRVNRHGAIMAGQAGQRVRSRLADRLGDGGRVVSVVGGCLEGLPVPGLTTCC